MKTCKTKPILFESKSGFTLVEVLVACSILVLIVLLASQMINSSYQSVKGSRRLIDSDRVARMVFDRIGLDISKISRNSSMDIYFGKKKGNDKIYFFSEAPAGFESEISEKNTISLIGYQINDNYEDEPPFTGLMRLGKGLSWGNSSSSSIPSMINLTFPSGSYLPEPLSTIEGNNVSGAWPGATSDNSSDPDQHLLGAQVFRFEYYFLLKDGSYSTKPVMDKTSFSNNLSASTPPTILSDVKGGYRSGSRWWDEVHARGYRCTNPANGNASWRPLGLDDVSAIIINIAILDKNSIAIVSRLSDMIQLQEQFQDAEEKSLRSDPPEVLMEEWNKTLSSMIANPPANIPKVVAGQIRLYQQVFTINP